MTFAPTPQQQDILSALEFSDDNLAVVARAGTGKTTTALLFPPVILARNPRAEIAFCCFGKGISVEINDKLKAAGYDWRQVQATTTHGMGWGLVRFQFRLSNDNINGYKVRDLVAAQTADLEAARAAARRENRTEDARRIEAQLWQTPWWQFRGQIIKLVDLAKVDGFGYFDDCRIGSADDWMRMARHYDVDGLEEREDMEVAVECAQAIYRASLADTTQVDFADMVLWPLVKGIRVKFQKDVIIVDEAQDTSRARQALIEKFMKPGGRIIVIGDDRQAIMGFAGASTTALEDLIERFACRALPLTVTWRCPKSVVSLARGYVPDYEAAGAAPEGEVIHMRGLPVDLRPGDAVLCRNVAPLVDMAFSLIRQGKAAKVEGRAIGEGLIALSRRWKVTSVDELLQRLDIYEDREVAKAIAKGQDDKVEALKDKCDTLREIARVCILRGKTEAADVAAFISDLFVDGASAVIILASYHRAKGREWDRVVLWDHGRRSPSPYAKQPWQRRQEENLAYVALTRAKQTLVFGTPEPKPGAEAA